MTTCLRYPKGYQFFDSNGAPLAIASLTYFQAGTTTLQNTYSDSAGTIPNANPIVLDGSGRLTVDVYLGSVANYKEVLTSSAGAVVSPWPADNIPCASTNSGSGSATNLSAAYTATSVSVQSSTGSAASLASANSTYAGILTSADKQKLDGIAAGAQVQPTSAQIVSSIDTQLGNTGWRADLTGDSGSGGIHGLVPAPAAGTAAAGKFLKADGTWSVPAGSGSQVNSDWNATTGVAQILNKPTLGTAAAQNIPASGNASTSQVVYGTDTRLSDARTPLSHASTHASGGSDPISISASQVSGIPASLASQNLDNVARLGIGTTDTTNKLSVSGATSLFSNSGDCRVTVSKGASTNTAAFNFQDNFSTRVQFGLLGNDSFTISNSPDGSTFNNAIVATTGGAVSFPNSAGFTGDTGSGGSVGLVPAPAAGTAAANKFLKADGTWSAPPVPNWQSISYSTTIPLTNFSYMPRQVVSAPITFAAGTSPVVGCMCYLRLVADGNNTPNFSAFKESGVSSGYNNTSGIDNQITFWYDGIDYWFAVQQQVNAQPYPIPNFQSAAIANASPNVLAITLAANLNSAQVPAASAFSVSASGGAATVSSVALSGAVASLTLSRSIAAGETVTVSYTQPSTNPLIDSTSTWLTPAFSGKSVTNNVTGNTVLRFTTRTANYTETADSTFGYDYVGTGGSTSYTDTGVTSTGLPASSDGYMGAVIGSLTSGSNGAVIGLKTSSSNGSFSTFTYGIFANNSTQYNVITGGSSASPDTVVAPAVNDVIRVRRAGTSVYAEVSKNGGSTWTTVKTWTGDAGAKLYGGGTGGASEGLNQLFSSNNWA